LERPELSSHGKERTEKRQQNDKIREKIAEKKITESSQSAGPVQCQVGQRIERNLLTKIRQQKNPLTLSASFSPFSPFSPPTKWTKMDQIEAKLEPETVIGGRKGRGKLAAQQRATKLDHAPKW